jgi:isocitrate/isopropylmalate dehydrogenase
LEHPISVGHYKNTGEILPNHFVEECKKADALLLAAIGLPDVCLPDEYRVHKIIILNRETRNMIATLPDLSPFGPPDSQPVVSALIVSPTPFG